MFKIEKVEIEGFWNRFDVQCQFNEDVNIIIGRNGTGKTTFMNILHSILTADLMGLSENDFRSAKITLVDGNKRKTIKVKKSNEDDFQFPEMEYQISKSKTNFRLIAAEDRRSSSSSFRRRLYHESFELRQQLDQLTAVSSLSVYRLRHEDEYEVRDRSGARIVSPVDYRLDQVLAGLTKFQLELTEQAQEIAKSLQKDVLASILYGEDDANDSGWELDFDKDTEQNNLVNAYSQLNSIDAEVRKKIRFHVSAIKSTIDNILVEKDQENEINKAAIDIKPLEALRKTRRIIKLSLEAQDETQKIYSQRELFLNIIRKFIIDKKFSFSSGRLVVENKSGEIDYTKLSSGEKQLIILMVEALLQKGQKHIFLADEPELSLHIAWQRQIIPAIRQINPNAQVIVATHSPEVASKYKESIKDMEKLIHG